MKRNTSEIIAAQLLKEKGMKGNPQIIAELNMLFATELTGITQYMIHSNMCDNWGYAELASFIEARAKQEMHHAENLLARILFLDGLPVAKMNPVVLGTTVEEMHQLDTQLELTAVINYNKAVALAISLNDGGSRELFEKILHDEEDHLNDLESHLVQIKQTGIQNYLAEKI